MAARPRRVAWGLTPRVLRRVVVSAANPTIRADQPRQHAPNIVRTRFTTIGAFESSTLRMLVGFAALTTTLHDDVAGRWTREAIAGVSAWVCGERMRRLPCGGLEPAMALKKLHSAPCFGPLFCTLRPCIRTWRESGRQSKHPDNRSRCTLPAISPDQECQSAQTCVRHPSLPRTE